MAVAHDMGLALVAGFFAFVLVSVILTVSRQVVRNPIENRLSALPFTGIAILLLVMALIEEFLFRWLLIGQLGRLTGLIPAVLLSIILFTLAHRTNDRLTFGATLNLAFVSLILALVYLRWGLWVVSAAHAGWNLAEWGLGYTVSGEKNRKLLPSPAHREVKGEPYGPEAHWSASLVLSLILLILIDLNYLHF